MTRTNLLRRTRPNRLTISALSIIVMIAVACASSEDDGSDSGSIACEYHPFGDSSVEFDTPSTAELAAFQALIRVRTTGHSFGEETAELENVVRVDEVVTGPASEGNVLGLRSGFELCLENGRDYYVLANETDESGFLQVPHPWATFPVINNRITLHPDMRKDDLIGDFHGLDPVLFKRNFVDFVGRDDIEVD